MNRISEMWQPEEMGDAHDTSWFIDYCEGFGGLVCYQWRPDKTREILYAQFNQTEREFMRSVWTNRSNKFGAALVGDVVVSVGAKLVGTLAEPGSFSQSIMLVAWDKLCSN